MTEFIPTNDLEVALEQAHQGLLPVPSLLRVLVDSDLAVPSASEVMGNGQGFQPLLFSKEQTQMLACFTDKARIG